MEAVTQTLRFVELQTRLEKLKQLLLPQPTYAIAEVLDEERTTRLAFEDKEELAQEMAKLNTQFKRLEQEMDKAQSLGGTEDQIAGQVEFDDSSHETWVYTQMSITQTAGVNACWKVAYKLHQAYEGKGYISMQTRLSERDRQANQRARNNITREVDQKMIEIAFGLAEVLNTLHGPESRWDRTWLTIPQRYKVVEHAFATLRHAVAGLILAQSNSEELESEPKARKKNAKKDERPMVWPSMPEISLI